MCKACLVFTSWLERNYLGENLVHSTYILYKIVQKLKAQLFYHIHAFIQRYIRGSIQSHKREALTKNKFFTYRLALNRHLECGESKANSRFKILSLVKNFSNSSVKGTNWCTFFQNFLGKRCQYLLIWIFFQILTENSKSNRSQSNFWALKFRLFWAVGLRSNNGVELASPEFDLHSVISIFLQPYIKITATAVLPLLVIHKKQNENNTLWKIPGMCYFYHYATSLLSDLNISHSRYNTLMRKMTSQH